MLSRPQPYTTALQMLHSPFLIPSPRPSNNDIMHCTVPFWGSPHIKLYIISVDYLPNQSVCRFLKRSPHHFHSFCNGALSYADGRSSMYTQKAHSNNQHTSITQNVCSKISHYGPQPAKSFYAPFSIFLVRSSAISTLKDHFSFHFGMGP